MGKMSELDMTIADLRKAAEIITEAANTLAEAFSGKMKEPAEPAKPALTLPEVRAVLGQKSKDGFTAQIRQLLLRYGADRLSAIDPVRYNDLLADAEGLVKEEDADAT